VSDSRATWEACHYRSMHAFKRCRCGFMACQADSNGSLSGSCQLQQISSPCFNLEDINRFVHGSSATQQTLNTSGCLVEQVSECRGAQHRRQSTLFQLCSLLPLSRLSASRSLLVESRLDSSAKDMQLVDLHKQLAPFQALMQDCGVSTATELGGVISDMQATCKQQAAVAVVLRALWRSTRSK